MTDVAITREVLSWARERAGISPERLARAIPTKLEKIQAWEAGAGFPSFNQAQKIASTLSIPLGYLFLSEPPEIALPVADFRTVPGKEPIAISLNLQAVLDDALRKRDWYGQWRKEEGFAPIEFIGRFSAQSKRQEIIDDMRRVLDIPDDFAESIPTWEDHLRKLVQKVESAGILVLQSGIVGNNTHQKLLVEDFRGFALVHEFAPLIFINATDAIAARIFTLVHELAHLWTGTSGISNPEIVPDGNIVQQIEDLCNQTSAEFLAPTAEVHRRWNNQMDPVGNADELAHRFRISSQVALRRGYDLKLITREEFFQAFQIISAAGKAKKKSKGGNFYNSFFSRNSHRFTQELFSAVYSGRVSYVDAARLLNTHPGKVSKAMDKSI